MVHNYFEVQNIFHHFLLDEQCKRMVSEGISSKLMTLLKPRDSSSSASDIVNETSPTLQHAILSCLRNLAIPGNMQLK